MQNIITITGLVATTPRHLVTDKGKPVTSFRLASAEKKFDAELNRWIDTNTNWYTISCLGNLAVNANASLGKGERVIVTGELILREHANGNGMLMSVEVLASSLGHDLAWGTSEFKRTSLSRDVDVFI